MWPFRRRVPEPPLSQSECAKAHGQPGLYPGLWALLDDARKVLEAMDAPPGEYMAVKKRLGLVMERVDPTARMP